jgi:hypothetical protein
MHRSSVVRRRVVQKRIAGGRVRRSYVTNESGAVMKVGAMYVSDMYTRPIRRNGTPTGITSVAVSGRFPLTRAGTIS